VSFGSATCSKAAFARPGQRVRVTAQLIDCANGGHLWAERYDRSLDDIFAVQDEITRSIVAALALSITPESETSAADKGTRDIKAYDLFLKGRDLAWQITRSSNERAILLLESAIARDAGFARAHAILGHAHLANWLNRWSDDPAADERRALELAETAIRLNAFDPHGYWIVGAVYLWRREYPLALSMTQRALALDPRFLPAFSSLGGALLGLGRAEEALRVFESARLSDPLSPTIMLHYRARALCMLHRFEEAVPVLNERIVRSPETDVSRALLASVYGHLGRSDQAKAAWDELFSVNPDYSLALRRTMLSESEFELLARGLRQAGLVE
jgi:adenylate cyclase